MELELKHTNIFTENYNAYNNGKRIIINQGGARSSKTYSIIQLLIILCLTNKRIICSVVRKTFPSLRGSVLRDFIEIMNNLDIYDENRHNKTEQKYTFDNGSIIEFFSIDDAQKIRGRKRTICYCNEANELTFDDYQQLALRTTHTIFLDYNPSDNEHFIYDLVNRDNSILIKSTYKDNPFLQDEIVNEIERLIEVDENYYKIYALGEKPIPTTRIYNHFQQYDKIDSDDFIYGLDFGYNHATALIKVYNIDECFYCEEIIYKQHLTSGDLITLMNSLEVSKKAYIYADYSRPEIITEIRRAGFNIKDAVKDVKEGINAVKTHKVFINKSSTNLWSEYKKYSWKTKGEEVLDEPIKLYDDCMDALRYAIYSYKKKQPNSKMFKFY